MFPGFRKCQQVGFCFCFTEYHLNLNKEHMSSTNIDLKYFFFLEKLTQESGCTALKKKRR